MGSRSTSAFILLCFLCAGIVQSRKIVTHLPGYNGTLPFYLETGYVTVDELNGGKFFYYFIESEGNPSEDPVVLWLTGGPGCSALSGIIFEIGPFKIVKTPYNGSVPELEYHPYAWTKNASIIFVDTPLWAGFSYSSNPKGYELGEKIACLQIYKFLMQWFLDHPNYLPHTFYVAGDSYAGKIVPVVTQLVSEGIEAGHDHQPLLNLKGYLVGNPIVSKKIDIKSQVPYAHGVGILSDQLFELTQKKCIGEDYNNPTSVGCAELLDVFKDSYTAYLSYFWANDNATRDALGIEKGIKEEWLRCPVLPYEHDITSSVKYHYNLTTRGYRVLIYSGDHDLVVPFLSTQTWVRSLNFPVVDAWRAWHVDGQTAGFAETYSNNLTFATVRNGGHTAPEYQPIECLAMFQRWTSYQPL